MRMKPLPMSIFALIILVAPAVAYAGITVSISDGTTTLTQTRGSLKLVSTETKNSSGVLTMNLLQNCTAPCNVFFPSGSTTRQTSDTFRISDIASSPKARVVLTDSTTDKLELKGIRVTSLTTGRTLRITFANALGDFTQISSSSGTYPASVALVGSFKNATSTSQATACASGPSVPCASMSLTVKGIALNGVGSNTSTFLSTSVPCSSTSTQAPCAPAGVSGSFSAVLGTFTASDLGSISCGTTCAPTHRATLTAKFNGANEVLALANSGTAATAETGIEDPNSLIGILEALALEAGGNMFVAFTAGNDLHRVVPQPPLTNQTRNINNSSSIPLSFGYQQATLTPIDSFSMISLALPDDESLPPGDQQRNDASYVSFIPSLLRFRDIRTLALDYTEVVGDSSSGDPRLQDLVNFIGCSGGSFRVDILLAIDGIETPVISVYLGSNPATSFKSCGGTTLPVANLVDDGVARVDTTAVGGSCCVTFSRAQSQFGRFDVRAITVVVDPGFGVDPASHKVELRSMLVNGFSSVDDPNDDRAPTFVTATNFQPSCDMPTSGRFMRITKTAVAVDSAFQPEIVKIIPDSGISNNGCKFSANVNVLDLDPIAGGTTYQVDMCLFGQRDDPNEVDSWVGLCPFEAGIMQLK